MEILIVAMWAMIPTVAISMIHATIQSGDYHPFFTVMFGGIIFGISFTIISTIIY